MTGTDFYEPLSDPELGARHASSGTSLWVSENAAEVYRAEFLAVSILLRSGARRRGKLSVPSPCSEARRCAKERLADLVRAYAAERVDEGYEPGVHDADGARNSRASVLAAAKGACAGLLAVHAATRALWAGSTGNRHAGRRTRSAGAARGKHRSPSRRAFADSRRRAFKRWPRELGGKSGGFLAERAQLGNV